MGQLDCRGRLHHQGKANGSIPTCSSSRRGSSKTLRIPILLGRGFDLRDDKGTPEVAIVNEKFARRYFGSASPIGRHIGMGGNPGTKLDIEIVGVVRDTKYENLREEIPYELYRALPPGGFRGTA